MLEEGKLHRDQEGGLMPVEVGLYFSITE